MAIDREEFSALINSLARCNAVSSVILSQMGVLLGCITWNDIILESVRIQYSQKTLVIKMQQPGSVYF